MTDETFEKATETSRDAMADVDHTSPYTDRSFGEACAFRRGPTVAADGGRDTDAKPAQTMDDVDHEHPHADANDANRVFERGTEGRDETV